MLISLPSEIFELIIDSLDTQSVRTLSLVCTALLPHCRKHLFETLSVPEANRGDQTAKAFWELVRRTPELGRYIRKIVYIIDHEPPEDASILPVSQQLAQLQSLHIARDRYTKRWNVSPHRHALLSLLPLPTLTHLKLSGLDNFFLADLIPCVGLEYLEIYSVYFKDGDASLPISVHKPITIDRLRITDQLAQTLGVLSTAQRPDGQSIFDLTTVNALHVRLVTKKDVREMIKCFGKPGQRLVDVEMDWSYVYPSCEGMCDILMGSLETLRRLNVTVLLSYDSQKEDPIPALCLELEKLRCQNVLETFQITAYLHRDLDLADKWCSLDETLSEAGWFSLQNVSLCITVCRTVDVTDFWMEEAALTLRQKYFPKLASSSTIQFGINFDICD